MMKQIPLLTWASKTFEPAPSLHTLRRWARNGLIIPAPVLIGREYRVLENATYIPPSRHISLQELTVLHSTDPIVNDIISGKTSQPR